MSKINDLLAQREEAQSRCSVAASSINQAQKRLEETLASGRDTGQIRQILKKCQVLAKDAESQKQAVVGQINDYYNARDGERASEIVRGIEANIQTFYS